MSHILAQRPVGLTKLSTCQYTGIIVWLVKDTIWIWRNHTELLSRQTPIIWNTPQHHEKIQSIHVVGVKTEVGLLLLTCLCLPHEVIILHGIFPATTPKTEHCTYDVTCDTKTNKHIPFNGFNVQLANTNNIIVSAWNRQEYFIRTWLVDLKTGKFNLHTQMNQKMKNLRSNFIGVLDDQTWIHVSATYSKLKFDRLQKIDNSNKDDSMSLHPLGNHDEYQGLIQPKDQIEQVIPLWKHENTLWFVLLRLPTVIVSASHDRSSLNMSFTSTPNIYNDTRSSTGVLDSLKNIYQSEDQQQSAQCPSATLCSLQYTSASHKFCQKTRLNLPAGVGRLTASYDTTHKELVLVTNDKILAIDIQTSNGIPNFGKISEENFDISPYGRIVNAMPTKTHEDNNCEWIVLCTPHTTNALGCQLQPEPSSKRINCVTLLSMSKTSIEKMDDVSSNKKLSESTLKLPTDTTITADVTAPLSFKRHTKPITHHKNKCNTRPEQNFASAQHTTAAIRALAMAAVAKADAARALAMLQLEPASLSEAKSTALSAIQQAELALSEVSRTQDD